jgi:hypothetical protein
MQKAHADGAPSRPELPPSTAYDGHPIGATAYFDDASRQGMVELVIYGYWHPGKPHFCPGCDYDVPENDFLNRKRGEWFDIDQKYIAKGEPSRCAVLQLAK